MLTTDRLEEVLTNIPRLTIGVLGDLFLDRYLDIDAALTEPSLETGLDAYQVTDVRSTPGAAGTVMNNLVALGVGKVSAISVLGNDGEGYELRQVLDRLQVIDAAGLVFRPDRRTPTYTKPMLRRPGEVARELNRLDIKNRTRMPADAEEQVLAALERSWDRLDALVVLDQVSETDCGVVTVRVRRALSALGEAHPDRLILADSRARIGLFASVWLKPNQRECVQAVRGTCDETAARACAVELAQRVRRPVFCTCGAAGICVTDPRPGREYTTQIPAYPVSGAVDIVGAGDSTSAGLACAIAAGATLEEAAAFGNLIASITIQQIGTTGTASPEQVRQRWREVARL